jgi:hypothetical protein
MSDRRYSYDNKGRRCVESKDDYKKRHNGKSPDCFIAGTMVKTLFGDKPIESIKEGDCVYTPFGIQKVLKNWKTETEEITTVLFSNGAKISSKNNHRYYTDNGFIPACKLLDSMIECFSWGKILLWQVKSLFSTKARSISFKQAVDTIQSGKIIMGRDFFTGSFGLNTTGLFQKDTRFTILIRIGATMIYPILKWFGQKIIYRDTSKNTIKTQGTKQRIKLISTQLEIQQKNGMDQTQEENGIAYTEKSHGKEERKQSLFVQRAVKSLKHILIHVQSIVQNHAQINIAGSTQKQHSKNVLFAEKNTKRKTQMPKKRNVVAVRVEQNCVGKTDVYNLTLEKHNVYYANGILVENCVDALLLCYYTGKNTAFDDDTLQALAARRKRWKKN